MGLLALALAAVGIARALPDPVGVDAADSERKLAAFLQNKDAYDTLVLGTSLVHRGIDPLVFDARTAELGRPTHSFNAGLPAMDAFEQEFLLREILAHRPARLAHVLIAPDMIASPISDEHLRNRRTALWHDWQATVRVSEGLLEKSASGRTTFPQLYRHWQAWFFRATNVGEVRQRCGAWLRAEGAQGVGMSVGVPGRTEEEHFALLGDDGRGFVALDRLVERVRPELCAEQLAFRAQFLADEATFHERVAAFANRPQPLGTPHAFETAYLERLSRLVEEAGATLVVCVLPGGTVEDRDWLLRAHRAGQIPRWIDLSSPREHPELYASENRFDRFHVNEAGSVRMTRLLAERFADLPRDAGPSDVWGKPFTDEAPKSQPRPAEEPPR